MPATKGLLITGVHGEDFPHATAKFKISVILHHSEQQLHQ